MKHIGRRIAAGAIGLTLVGSAAFAASHLQAGPQGDGTAVTSVGMKVTPAGTQTTLGDLPLNSALSPNADLLAVTNNGQGTQSLQLLDAHTGAVLQTLSYAAPESLYLGLAWSPDGQTLYASAAANAKIRIFHLAGGTLTEGTPIKLPTTDASGKKLTLYPAGLALTPDGKRLVVADQLADAVSVVDLGTGAVQTAPVGHAPAYVAVSPDGKTAYVTNQGGAEVSVADVSTATPKVTGSIPVGFHPNKVVLSHDGATAYVANGDADTVSVVDTASTAHKELRVSPAGQDLIGSNPTGMALDEAARKLYVTNSGTNAVAVVDLGNGSLAGQIPVGWYPSSIAQVGDRLLVTNAKGLGAGPNNGAGYPDPTKPGYAAEDQYSGSMIKGTLSAVTIPGNHGQLQKLTEQVVRNNRPNPTGGDVIPKHPGDSTPIKHVIYVVKENRTYDQVLGDLGKGNGDPSLTLFKDDSAPNTRELSRRFTTFDNFYADAEVSANGWNWVTQANSNPLAEQLWPANYSGRQAPYPSENGDPAITAQQDRPYFWQRLDQKGVSFRNYGFFVNNTKGSFVGTDPVLDAKTDHAYHGYDLNCPDSSGTFVAQSTSCGTPRVDEWIKDFTANEAAGSVPAVQMVRLPNDHTRATATGKPTPQAFVADNDYALGRLVDTVSHSSIWKDTAIFVTEDDAQNGPDHVDAHRTLALVISPYTQTGKVDSTFYSTASMLHTMELVTGLSPMTQFDQFATPMSAAFTPKADTGAYDAIRPTYDMTRLNGTNAPLAKAAAAQNTSVEDAMDMNLFNEAIWKSVKGADAQLPATQHNVITAAAGVAAPAEAPASGTSAPAGAGAKSDD